MRRFIIVGTNVHTDGMFSLNDICGSTERLDVLVRAVTSAFVLSYGLRKDVELYLILTGPPKSPVCIKFIGKKLRYLNPDERSTAALIKHALLKCNDEEVESTPGIFVSHKSFFDVINEFQKEKLIYLKEDGDFIMNAKIPNDSIFILGNHLDLPCSMEKYLIDMKVPSISLGKKSLHTHQCITIVHWYLDELWKE